MQHERKMAMENLKEYFAKLHLVGKVGRKTGDNSISLYFYSDKERAKFDLESHPLLGRADLPTLKWHEAGRPGELCCYDGVFHIWIREEKFHRANYAEQI